MSTKTNNPVVRCVLLLLALASCGVCVWPCWEWWDGTRSFHEPKLLATVPNVIGDERVHPTFASPGNRLLVGGSALGVLDLDTGVREPFAVTADVDAAICSRGGEVLACVSKDNIVTLLEVATGAERGRFVVEGAMLFGWVGITPDGNMVVTTGEDLEDLIAWDVDTGERLASFDTMWWARYRRWYKSPSGRTPASSKTEDEP